MRSDSLVPMVLDLFQIESFPVLPHDIAEVTQELYNLLRQKINPAAQVKA